MYWKEHTYSKSMEGSFFLSSSSSPLSLHHLKLVFKYKLRRDDGRNVNFLDENLVKVKVGVQGEEDEFFIVLL